MINDLGNTAETNEEKHTVVTKRAWIHETERLISFHWIEGAMLYKAEETVFWNGLKNLGFRDIGFNKQTFMTLNSTCNGPDMRKTAMVPIR